MQTHFQRLQFVAKQREIQTERVTTEIVEIFPIQFYAIIDLFCVDWERITKCELFNAIYNWIEHSHVSFNWIDVWKLCSASSFTFNLNSEWNEDKEFAIMGAISSIKENKTQSFILFLPSDSGSPTTDIHKSRILWKLGTNTFPTNSLFKNW